MQNKRIEKDSGPPVDLSRTAETYDDWCKTPLGAVVTALEEELLAELFPPIRPGMRVLDVGCGTGSFTLKLAGMGADAIGVDVSRAMIERARSKVKAGLEGNHSPTFQAADARRLPFPASSFDLVTALLVLEFSGDPQAVVLEAARVLRPGGHLLVAALNRNSLWAVVRKARALVRRSIYRDARFLPPRQLASLMRRAGIEPVSEGQAVYFPPLSSRWVLTRSQAIESVGRRLFPQCGAYVAILGQRAHG